MVSRVKNFGRVAGVLFLVAGAVSLGVVADFVDDYTRLLFLVVSWVLFLSFGIALEMRAKARYGGA